MENLIIEETTKTPGVTFDFIEGTLTIKGRSIPENSVAFYEPVLTAMDSYSHAPKAISKIVIQLDYFITSSSKCLLDLFKK
jgi:hypothetical protein